jgi:hypothetical protein
MNRSTLPQLEQQCSIIEEEMKHAWAAAQSTPPARLYHYTDAQGLHGILSSGRFWATNIGFLNDRSELKYGCAIVTEALERRAHASSKLEREFIERALRVFNVFDGLFELYVACFCEDGDLLSQWRGYGGNGVGYAVAMDARLMGLRTPGRTPVDFVLRRVIYDYSEQAQLIDSLTQKTVDLLLDIERESGEEVAWNALPRLCHFFRDEVSEFLFCFKHPAFREEAEWRAVSVAGLYDDDSRVKFRPSRAGLIPYVEMEFSPSAGQMTAKIPITEIVCGPTAYPYPAQKALSLYLRNIGYSHVEVRASQIPLR